MALLSFVESAPRAYRLKVGNADLFRNSTEPGTSPSLWETMGNVFERSIIDNISEHDARWKVLQPPTGSGKTQGACLYSAMQAKRNRDTQGNLKPVGVLLVTRLIKQADDLAAQVNAMAGANVAVAHHSKSGTDADDIGRYDVLVVTHQAFVNAAETLAGAAWSRLVQWNGGHRLLTAYFSDREQPRSGRGGDRVSVLAARQG
ncbi:hypothetical protein HAP41_0000028980 [Bradyrhizobium barranii subsp. apii]|uniref:Uncharacterized protein n=1 Tax=Bradyrhizobium barranii subsp. apii TaxID=2819348 RepID=A0A8T5V683_9BRAD|nr:hypothetical protein [Bradyrhizobium barranii]UPT84396.1 hypothetical protein HAP41_0000028980 [Bradyrhizobium barranii subsp. apii]